MRDPRSVSPPFTIPTIWSLVLNVYFKKKEEGVSQCDFTLFLSGYLSGNKSEYSILGDLISILRQPLQFIIGHSL